MQHPRMDKLAIRRAVEQSTKESAALADRIIPDDYVRSARVECFLKVRLGKP